MSGRPAKSLWWNIGAMFGNIAAGFRGDPNNPPRRLYQPAPPTPPPPPVPPVPPPPPVSPGRPVQPGAAPFVSQHVREARVETSTGPVTLRRTITDEVLPGAPPFPVAPPPAGWQPPQPPPPPPQQPPGPPRR